MATIHISESDAARDFAALMARVRAGEEIVIESEAVPVAVVRPVTECHVRLLSESLRILNERGSTITLDGNFGTDLEAVIHSHREPLDPSEWD
jgi:prevent-host-death family protein